MSPITHVGILGLVAVAACWSLAVVVYRVSVAGSLARKLAHLLIVEGIVLVSAGFPDMAFGLPVSYYESHPSFALFMSLVHHGGDAAMIALYPPFLALALNTNMTSVFAGKRARIGLAIFAGVFGLAVAFSQSRTVQTLFYFIVMALFIYALFVSIHAWRTAKSGIVRERAGIFALAFGLRDFGWIMSYAVFAWMIWTELDLGAVMEAPQMTAELRTFLFGKGVYALGTLVAVPLIAYGILRAQLFDIDLRIRWTIKQSTLAGIFVALMFLISEGASTLLSAELGNIAGLLAAAVVMFFLAPLQRFADRVAGAAMPNTKNTPEYISYRKMKVFGGALAEALQEGGISDRERSLLNHLRDSLEISSADAEALENELKAGGKAL
jgi:hypothetical protein